MLSGPIMRIAQSPPPHDQPVALIFQDIEFLDRHLDRALLVGSVAKGCGAG
jgi:hypothetical protein